MALVICSMFVFSEAECATLALMFEKKTMMERKILSTRSGCPFILYVFAPGSTVYKASELVVLG